MTKLEDISWISNIKVVDVNTDEATFPKNAWWIAWYPEFCNDHPICKKMKKVWIVDAKQRKWRGVPEYVDDDDVIITAGPAKTMKNVFYSEDRESAINFANALTSIPDGNYKDIIGNIQKVNNEINALKNKIVELNRVNTILTKLFTNPG